MVTPRVERYVRQRFDEAEAELVLSALREWRISYEAKPPGERLIAAVVLVADGSLGGTPRRLFTGQPQANAIACVRPPLLARGC